jgi:hypothetical protein
MAPGTRSGIKFQQTASGEWRGIEGGENKRLTTEEMNEFAARQNFLKEEPEGAMRESKEKEKCWSNLGQSWNR